MKLREEREARRATMDGRHEYVLSTVADRLQMSMEDAEEFMLDGDQVCVGEVGGGGRGEKKWGGGTIFCCFYWKS